MSMSDISERVHALGTSWEQFKQLNEARLREVEKKGAADPLYYEQLDRIGQAIDATKARMDKIETAYNRPGKDLGEGYPIPAAYQSEYKQAFCAYLRKGIESGLEKFESKALSVTSDADGGYLVTQSLASRMVQIVFESSPIRQIASVETISSDSLELIEDRQAAFAGWTAETASVTSDTTTPQIGKKQIAVYELYAQPKATQRLIDDAAIDIESWLAEKVADVFSRTENTAFVSGDGIGKPRGFLTYSSGTSWQQIEQVGSGSSGNITADKLIQLYYTLKADYARRATFVMNRASVQQVRLLKEATTNQYLWQPGLSAGQPDTLLGVPVVMASDMPVPAAAALAVAVGDFKSAYQIVDRIGFRTLRDPFTDKPFVKFYTTKRVGGDVNNFEALKLMVLS